MNKITLHLDKKRYSSKPTDVARINNDITKSVSTVTASELAELVGSNGQTVVLATMNGKRSKLNMVQQQALALDFDNKDDQTKAKTEGIFYQSIEDTLNDNFIQENAAFIYKTFSHEAKWEKFRVVFFLDEALTSNEQVTAAYEHLMNLYPNADRATKDSSRLFYGGTEAIEINYNNQLAVSGLPEATKAEPKAIKKASPKKADQKPEATEETPTWKLIQQGEKELVKERLSGYSLTLNSETQAMNYMKTLNMNEVLGVTFNPTFDFFHFEKSPSASIFQKDGTDIWLYKCHSSSHPFTGNIIHVVGKLAGLQYTDAIDYLIELMSIKIVESKEIAELKKQYSIFQHTLLSADLKETYPAIHNRFWRYKTDINAILEVFKENTYTDDNGELRILSWMSADNLAIKLYGTKSKSGTIKRILNLMTYTDWIEKLDEKDIPPKLLKQLKENQNKNGYQRRSSMYELLKMNKDFFTHLNKICEVMIEQGMTMKTLNKEGLMSAGGAEVADKVFVQDKDRGMSKKTLAFYEDMSRLYDFHMETQPFIQQNDLLDELQVKWHSASYVSNTYGKLITQLLREKNAKKSRLTKALKEKWNLPPSKSSPTIIFSAE